DRLLRLHLPLGLGAQAFRAGQAGSHRDRAPFRSRRGGVQRRVHLLVECRDQPAGRAIEPALLHRRPLCLRARRRGGGRRTPEGPRGDHALTRLAQRPGVGHVQSERLLRRLRRHHQGVPGQMNASLAAELTEAERVRILAKSALFTPPPARLADGRRDLVGLSRAELAAELAEIGEKPFRAKQLWHWIYHQGATDFSRMSSIARPLQERLAERFVIGRPEVATVQTSADATRKFLFRFRDGQEAETVYIPDREEDRGAVCISSQVGCTLSCRFCHTGTQALVRNLGAAEIVGQFMAARDAYGEWPSPKGETPRLLSTIVLMGMGEPLYNYENVAKAMTIVMDNE